MSWILFCNTAVRQLQNSMSQTALRDSLLLCTTGPVPTSLKDVRLWDMTVVSLAVTLS